MGQIDKECKSSSHLPKRLLISSNPAKKRLNLSGHFAALVSKAAMVLFFLFAQAQIFAQIIIIGNPNIKAPSTTALSSSVKPSVAGQPVLLTATVTSPAQALPTGTVHFYDNASNTDLTPNGVALSSGIASFKTPVLNTNASFKAIYSGDSLNLASTSDIFTQTVNQPVIIINPNFFQTNTTIVSNTNPSIAGSQAVTFTATVTTTGNANLIGVVEFWDNTNNKNLTPGGVAVSNGVATFTTNSLPFGDLDITAIYRGDANGNQQSISNSLIQHVQLNITGIGVTLVSSSPGNTSNWGDIVTFTATVSTGIGAPSGLVNFTDNGKLVASVSMDNSGVAIFETRILTPGNHTFVANYFSISSSPLTQIVQSNYSTIFVGQGTGNNHSNVGIIASNQRFLNSEASFSYGEPITFAVNILGDGINIPTGNVTFIDNIDPQKLVELGTVGLDATGNCFFTTSILSAGSHSIYAVYSGNDIYLKDSSNASSFVNTKKGFNSYVKALITKSPTTTSLSSSLNPSIAGQQVTFSATVPLPYAGSNALPPQGDVTFTIDGVPQAPAPLTGNNFKAFFDISSLSPGNHTIQANYPGDANYTGSSSGTITQVVEPVGSVLLNFLGSSQSTQVNTVFPNPIMFDIIDINPRLVGGATVTFTAPASGPSGKFSNGSNTITVKTTALNSVGVADSGPFTANGIPGTYTVVATVQGMGTNSFTMTNTAPLVPITIGTSVPGLTFTADGVSFTANKTFTWEQGSSHTLTTSSPQSLGVGSQYTFNKWSNGASTLSNTITVPSTATSYTAQFQCTQEWVLDKDQDTYYAGDPVVACQSPGAGYVIKQNQKPGDCNDNDAAINPATLWYLDADGDGYSNKLYIPAPGGSCTPPQDGRHYIYNPKGQDCDDGDATYNPETTWVIDYDGDGYYTGAPYTGCYFIIPLGAVKKTTQLPGDCDDHNATVYPGAAELADGLDNNCNGIIDEGICKPTVITKNITVQITAGGTVVITPADVNNGSTDPCGSLTFSLDKSTFDCTNIGQNTVTLTAKDTSGAIASATAIVTVEDRTKPIVLTKNITAQIDAGGIATISARDVDNGSYDPCGLVLYQVDKTRFDCSNIGPNTVTLTVKDINGNIATGTAIVTIEDHTVPIVITKNITVQLANDGNATITARDVDNGSYDPCGLVSYEVDRTDFSCFDIGQNTVTLTVKDANGNSATGTAVVTVQGTGPRTWVLDNDRDGYYNGAVLFQCGTPPAGYTLLTNQLPGDCDDTKAAINPSTIWYKDADNDGYSDGTTAVGCTRPVNYKLSSELIASALDCADNNAAINPGAAEICDGIDNNCNGQIDEGVTTTFYKDADGDGYGNVLVTIQACSVPAGYVTNSSDCDDSNSAINPTTIWYEDRDGDGYTSGKTITQCERAKFYYGGVLSTTYTLGKLASELAGTALDCDDTQNGVNPALAWYKDADNDGYSDGSIVKQCTQPAGYKPAIALLALSGDCDDTKPTINPATLWYKDADNDGYSNGTTLRQCLQPAGYKPASALIALTGDCDDTRAIINPLTVWYKDADNDGFSDGTVIRQCLQPTGYKLATSLIAIAGDCDDTKASINPATVWYKDADNDKYSDGTTKKQCTRPAGYKPASELIALTGDCNDTDASIQAPKIYYQDADGDGYGNAAKPLTVCSLTAPAGYVVNKGDCNDANPAVNPGAVEICGNGIDDNCNGKIDETPCYTCANAVNLSTTAITSTSAQFNWAATANPVQWQVQYINTKTGSKCIDVTVAGNLRSLKVTGLSAGQGYQWKIRAKCGNSWTNYSSAISFKTTGTAATKTAVDDINNLTPVAEFKLHPNPTTGAFNLVMQQEDKEALTAVINIRDISGRIIKTDKVTLLKGILNENIRMPSGIAAGIYVVEVIVGKMVYNTKLVLVR